MPGSGVPRALPLLAVLASTSLAIPIAQSEPATMLHFDAIVVDTHDDTTQRFLDPAYDLGQRHETGGVDLPKAREGGLDAIFFSIYTPGTVTGRDAVLRARAQIAGVHRQVERNQDGLVLVTNASGIREAVAHGKVAALMGLEGGHMIANDLGVLREYFQAGVRYMTLTHSVNVDWADSSGDLPRHGGLTPFGREVVREMNRLGMLVDISHVSDETFEDVLETSSAPVFASHSSARALCDHPRNLSDDMIRRLAAKGGVVQVNFHAGFLSQAFNDVMNADDARIKKEIDTEVDKRCDDDEACQVDVLNALVRDHVAAGTLPRVEWTSIVDHIDHIVGLVGVDHVGLGSDFDGAIMPQGMEDAAGLPKITAALLDRGYAPGDVRKILGGNTLRLMEHVERAAGTP
jgi:membrane dipeptidase